MSADRAGGIRAVRENGRGPGSGSSEPGPWNSDAGHHGFEGRSVTGLACRDNKSKWSCPAVAGQVHLGAQPAAGASESVIGGFGPLGCPLLLAPAACW